MEATQKKSTKLTLFFPPPKGNSGALKSVVIGPFEASKLAYLLGLFSSGIVLSNLLPSCFETPPKVCGCSVAVCEGRW